MPETARNDVQRIRNRIVFVLQAELLYADFIVNGT